MAKGYRTDAAGNCLGYFDLDVVPENTADILWVESDVLPPIYIGPAQVSAALISQAQAALDKTDSVAIRCLKAGVAFPSEWQTYVTSLRAIVNSGTGAMPTQPDYPAGT